MKGVVFTGFLDLVEDNFGYLMVDKIIRTSELPSGGVYTSIGTYPHSEIVQLVVQLSRYTEIPISKLLNLYGQHFFGVLAAQYGHFLTRVTSAFQLLESIHHHIHVEVKKLYPDAELPHFATKRLDENTLEMVYSSERKMSDFAEGLIESCLKHYGETGTIEKTNITEDGSKVRFLITKR
jgi:hypothetical protein